MFDLILSQGRLADRKDGTIKGAKLTAQALADEYSITPITCGRPSAALNDNWKQSLSAGSEVLNEIELAIESSLLKGHHPCLIGNTCSSSFASLPLAVKYHPTAKVIWIDAHGDFNTPETTDSGYLGGMVLAGVCGLWESGRKKGVNPESVIVAGVRDLDPEEERLLHENKVTVLNPTSFSVESVLEAVGESDVWIHIDWDVLEPGYIPADYSVTGGLVPSQIECLLSSLSGRILGLEVTEFCAETGCNHTAELNYIVKTLAPFFKQHGN
ncbi:arginase family protein [Chromohalobacter israelensis]|nr:arginase family protein [Chromohalobacter salexigens]